MSNGSKGLPKTRSRRDYLGAADSLSVIRPRAAADDPEIYLSLEASGRITAFNGHVDLGTGIRTALAQIVAEELDVSVERITMVLGDSGSTPDQGPTIASETIQVTAIPLRRAAAQARQFLVQLAAHRWGVGADSLRTLDGHVLRAAENHADGSAGDGDSDSEGRLAYHSLLEGRHDRLILSDATRVKPVADYRIVGQSVQRVDIAAKATGEATYVHDVRLPSMLHGRVVRPPYAGVDSGPFVGTSLESVDQASLAGLEGIVAVVVLGDFIGVVAEREEQAAAAAERLVVHWKPTPTLQNLDNLQSALTAQSSRPRTLKDSGDVRASLETASIRMPRTYVWPYQLHASIGPSCAVADYRDDGLTVWSGTQNPLPLRADLALLFRLPETAIEVIRLEASGCYGRNCADDVVADAALLSRAVRRPVRVQLTREQEHLWEPKGAAQVMQVDGGLTADGNVAAYDFATRYPSNAAPTLALLLTGTVPAVAVVSEMGDRTAISPYAIHSMRIVVHDVAPIVRASWLRGVSALPNSFAHDCYIDELAAEAHVDPVEFRLRYLRDDRAAGLVRAVAERAGWQSHTEPRLTDSGGGRRRGAGFAYAQYVHGKFPGTAAAWSAWVAEVEVDTDSGDVHVRRVVVGQDSGLIINPAGVAHQIHGNVLQSISRTLKEEVSFAGSAITTREWGSYPILRFDEVPVVQVLMMPQPNEPPLGVGESASVPSAAAIANAIFDATGVRLREPPFTPERVRAALRTAGAGAATDDEGLPAARRLAQSEEWARQRDLATAPNMLPRRPTAWRRIVGAAGAALGVLAALMTWPAALAPTGGPDPSVYSAETIDQGRQLAAIGDCAVCHTAAGGNENAGGHPLETPFGIVYSTNITPDIDTGIGGWSYAAFERAMRTGLHRDGRRLYPAFPYTAYVNVSEHDLQALYAYLMSRPPVRAQTPANTLSWPFSWRPLLGVWNALFLRRSEFLAPAAKPADPARSAEWQRGAYLVEGLGHCSACHSPRNLLGAEARGDRYLAGGFVDGWEAPSLTQLSHAPIPWDETELYAYLRSGWTRLHGAAAGPMQAVVANLAQVDDADLHAMAHYIASLNETLPASAQAKLANILEVRAEPAAERTHAAGARLFEGACAACHDPVAGSLRAQPSLALNTNMHSDTPNNVLRAVIDGVNVPGLGHLGAMPGFGASLDDRQLADLLGYLRARFAADKKAWTEVEVAAARLRGTARFKPS
jgi:nicotinate dehydrogenase subunit B